MLQTFQCFNCCGMRKESVYYEETCSNCGTLMTLPSWNLDEMLVTSGSAAYTEQNQCHFTSIGSLLSDEPMLLSYAMNANYLPKAFQKTNLSAIFVHKKDADLSSWPKHITPIYSQYPQVDFFLFHNWLIKNTEFYGKFDISKLKLYSGTNVIIESDVTIAPGAIIGVDGARLIHKPDGTFFRALHGGSIYIGEGAYIGANAVIVRSLWRKPTTIGAGAFVGNLVNVGHNVTIEPGAIVLPGAILGGRSHIASTARVNLGAIILPGVRVAGTVQMGAVVTQDVPEGVAVSGNFAVDHELQIEHTKRLATGMFNDQMPILK